MCKDPPSLQPDMLEQIKAAAREGGKSRTWQIILGSGVFAAFFSLAGSFVIESRIKPAAQVDVALKQVLNLKRFEKYQELRDRVTRMSVDLENLVAVAERASTDKNLRKYVGPSTDKLSESMRLVYESRHDPTIAPIIGEHIDRILDDIGPELQKTQSSRPNDRGLILLYKEGGLTEWLKLVQEEIDKEILASRIG